MMLKQVLIIREDLKLGKGKACAQIAHASVSLYKKALIKNKRMVEDWERFGAKKVVLKASLEVMLEKVEEAERGKLITVVIRDAGLTQIPPGTITCVGIFGEEDEVDKITGKLKLF